MVWHSSRCNLVSQPNWQICSPQQFQKVFSLFSSEPVFPIHSVYLLTLWLVKLSDQSVWHVDVVQHDSCLSPMGEVRVVFIRVPPITVLITNLRRISTDTSTSLGGTSCCHCRWFSQDHSPFSFCYDGWFHTLPTVNHPARLEVSPHFRYVCCDNKVPIIVLTFWVLRLVRLSVQLDYFLSSTL